MDPYPTPHINAEPKDFAPTVLMPGDPLRSQFIAENFLTDAKLVNNVRGVQGYTGLYRGSPVSVMASGMGMPSIGIYSYELFNFFGVENILRVGSAGAISKNVHVRDVLLGQGACTTSRYAHTFRLPGDFAPIADWKLLSVSASIAEEMGLSFHVGNLLSSDVFYNDMEGISPESSPAVLWSRMGVLAIEMEAAALYMNAARAGKRALAICTVSDHVLTGESLPAHERQVSFTDMMELALRTAVSV